MEDDVTQPLRFVPGYTRRAPIDRYEEPREKMTAELEREFGVEVILCKMRKELRRTLASALVRDWPLNRRGL
jgi:hypothetical protein